jgi:tRNA pseudouridine13 synthase
MTIGADLTAEHSSWVLKHFPEDFLVREISEVSMASTHGLGATSCDYFLLRKCGYTTLEAIDRIAKHLSIESIAIGHSGLKDEDAVTEQTISISSELKAHDLPRTSEGNRWLETRALEQRQTALSVGGLLGNAFSVVIRNVDHQLARNLLATPEQLVYTLNYYDIQRFGVPGGPKKTHLLGDAIFKQHWDAAIAILRELGSSQSASALAWDGDPKAYFDRLDKRALGFFMSASSSFEFNSNLRRATREALGDRTLTVDVEGVTFVYGMSRYDATRILSAYPELGYTRYFWSEGELVAKAVARPTVLQTRVRVSNGRVDEEHGGASAVQVDFLLPPGAYATSLVRQLMFFAENQV